MGPARGVEGRGGGRGVSQVTGVGLEDLGRRLPAGLPGTRRVVGSDRTDGVEAHSRGAHLDLGEGLVELGLTPGEDCHVGAPLCELTRERES